MPWTFPLREVAGVFMSPCASIQRSPMGSSFVAMPHAADAPTEPAARLWSPPSTTGMAPALSEANELS